MSAPAPGKAPMIVPSTEDCSTHHFCCQITRQASRTGSDSRRLTACSRSVPRGRLTWRKTSDSPNKPIMTGIKSKPRIIGTLPNVYRGTPLTTSIPTVDSSMPRQAAINPLVVLPALTRALRLRPKTASQNRS